MSRIFTGDHHILKDGHSKIDFVSLEKTDADGVVVFHGHVSAQKSFELKIERPSFVCRSLVGVSCPCDNDWYQDSWMKRFIAYKKSKCNILCSLWISMCSEKPDAELPKGINIALPLTDGS